MRKCAWPVESAPDDGSPRVEVNESATERAKWSRALPWTSALTEAILSPARFRRKGPPPPPHPSGSLKAGGFWIRLDRTGKSFEWIEEKGWKIRHMEAQTQQRRSFPTPSAKSGDTLRRARGQGDQRRDRHLQRPTRLGSRGPPVQGFRDLGGVSWGGGGRWVRSPGVSGHRNGDC